MNTDKDEFNEEIGLRFGQCVTSYIEAERNLHLAITRAFVDAVIDAHVKEIVKQCVESMRCQTQSKHRQPKHIRKFNATCSKLLHENILTAR